MVITNNAAYGEEKYQEGYNTAYKNIPKSITIQLQYWNNEQGTYVTENSYKVNVGNIGTYNGPKSTRVYIAEWHY